MTRQYKGRKDLRANHPSSSSALVLAGNGAPGPEVSYVGSLTPPEAKGFRDCMLSNREVRWSLVLVLAGAGSRRDQPREFIESRKVLDAIPGLEDLTGLALMVS